MLWAQGVQNASHRGESHDVLWKELIPCSPCWESRGMRGQIHSTVQCCCQETSWMSQGSLLAPWALPAVITNVVCSPGALFLPLQIPLEPQHLTHISAQGLSPLRCCFFSISFINNLKWLLCWALPPIINRIKPLGQPQPRHDPTKGTQQQRITH